MRAFTAVATLLSFTAHAASGVTPGQFIELKVAAGSNFEGYQLVGSTDFPEFVPVDQVGDLATDWYLGYYTPIPGFDWYYINIVVDGVDRGLDLGGDMNSPGPLEWVPASVHIGTQIHNMWQAVDPARGSQFYYTSVVVGYSAYPFACANSTGRYQLSVYPHGQQPENCREVQLVWNTAS
ncbi:hypothetical protein ONZ43_g1227 [Nemania bipapillata]|uniref:Uncharacterized protein n=1 Tax=Nemania bipapillata TaxID=110536 RepID=A0ACC2J5A7_9PEZI|nr:hypothetical protein ONZ43_g1227 [Nemania bipapillata]